MAQPEFKVSGIVLDTPDPRELAGFYSQASSNSHHNIRGDGAGLPPIEGCWWRLLHQLGAVPRGRSGPTGDPRHQAAWTAGGSQCRALQARGFPVRAPQVVAARLDADRATKAAVMSAAYRRRSAPTRARRM